MKKLIIILFAAALSNSLMSQPGKTKPKAPVKTVAVQPVFKNLEDSASYLVGIGWARTAIQQGVTKLNTALLVKACDSTFANKPGLLPENMTGNLVQRCAAQLKAGKPTSIKKISKSSLKSLEDSTSYAIGLTLANFYKPYGVTKLNTKMIGTAFNDLLAKKPSVLDERMATNILNRYLSEKQEEQIKPAIDAGRAFLENNKKRPEVKTTASGLQYQIIKEGTGVKPILTDTFVVHYKGTLIDGTEFDNSYKRGQPLEYPLGAVVRGWVEGLQLMPVGSKFNLYIPYELGYGPFGNPPVIPGGAVLIFEMELLNVKHLKAN